MNEVTQLTLALATLVTSTAALVAALGAIFASLNNRKNIRKVQDQTNGMMAEMKTSAEARGNLQGRADEQTEFPRGR